jgi:hypothetical protein
MCLDESRKWGRVVHSDGGLEIPRVIMNVTALSRWLAQIVL